MSIGQKNLVDLPGSGSGDKPSAGEKPKVKPPPTTPAADKDLRTRLAACFDRIAVAAEARGDEELADIIREDMEVMAAGLVSLTRPVRALRTPIVMLLGIVEPVMAFSRITRVMIERLLDRRAARRTEDDPGTPPR